MANKSSESVLENTLEDDVWMDSFDKLLKARPVLRELNIIKKDVRASFNIDSSVENCSRDGSDFLAPLPQKQISKENTKRHGSISTPVANRLTINPFKCSLSPIGNWEYRFFNNVEQNKMTTANTEQLHGTPIHPEIVVVDYDSVHDSPIKPFMKRKLSLLVPPRKIGQKRTHICFDPNVLQYEPSRDVSKNLSDIAKEELQVMERPTSLTLKPGKWRKSIITWRRTHISLYGKRSSNNLTNESVKLVNLITQIGRKRKSFYLKTEPENESSRYTVSIGSNSEFQKLVLMRCQQRRPMQFERLYGETKLKNCEKIGEGAFGEVYMYGKSQNEDDGTVLKVIPIEGSLRINGEVQKSYEQIYPEIVISVELCNLSKMNKANATSGFVNIKKVACVQGKYPAHMIKLWEKFDEERSSENEHPNIFTNAQIYIVLELAFGGKDLEAFLFTNAEQAYYALQQIILTLAVAEEAYQFEHRDLHWGNILINKTKDKQFQYKLNDKLLTLPTKGIKVTLIDYTLSRMTYNNSCLYNDLSVDEELFGANGDYQFEIYRLMRAELKNNWEAYKPKTNVFWLSYILCKMVDGVKYKHKRAKAHLQYMNRLKQLKESIINFNSAADCARHLHKLS